jgi:hypothetical protein
VHQNTRHTGASAAAHSEADNLPHKESRTTAESMLNSIQLSTAAFRLKSNVACAVN